MANEYVNKIVLGNETLLDLTADTATAADVAQGKTFHLATGAPATGTASGGGGDGWTKVYSFSKEATTTSTSAVTWTTATVGAIPADKLLYIRIRDSAGPRAEHFYGCDTLAIPRFVAGAAWNFVQILSKYDENNTLSFAWPTSTVSPTSYGIWVSGVLSSAGRITFKARYNATSSYTINGTFNVDVFTADYPSGYPSIHGE